MTGGNSPGMKDTRHGFAGFLFPVNLSRLREFLITMGDRPNADVWQVQIEEGIIVSITHAHT
jgi:hypothetical protein